MTRSVRSRSRALRISAALLAAPLALSPMCAPPAVAQWVVYDPTNYAQNVLTAARTLQQVNQQITQLQNEATMLINQARNLASLPYSSLQQLQQSVQRTQQLLAEAQGIALNVQQIDRAFQTTYGNASMSASDQALVAGARERWQNTVGGLQDAMRVQAGVVGNIDTNRGEMSALVGQSQGATGALQRRLFPAAIERRPTAEGLLAFLVNGQRGVIVELTAETDFVVRNPLFQEAADAIARTALNAEGEIAETLAAPSPDGQGAVADYVRRLATTFGESIHLRRATALSTESGVIGAYAHNAPAPGLGRMVALVAISGAADNPTAVSVAGKLAMHIVGAAPLWASVEQVPPSIRDQKRLRVDDGGDHAPNARVITTDIEARLERFYDQTVLPRQHYLVEPSMTVAEYLAAEGGPDAYVEGFVCFRIAEDAAHDARVAEASEFEWTFGNDWSDERPSKIIPIGNERVFEISPRGPKLRDDRDAVDLINAAWSGGATILALPVERLSADFFPLSTRKAGTILQKFSNFGTRVAIVGDISAELSRSSALRDFVYESNHRGQVVFVPDLEALTKAMRRSPHNSGDTA